MKTGVVIIVAWTAVLALRAAEVVPLREICDHYQQYSGEYVTVDAAFYFGFEACSVVDASLKDRDFRVWFDWDEIALKRTSGDRGLLLLGLLQSETIAGSHGFTLGKGRLRGFIQISASRMRAKQRGADRPLPEPLAGFGHLNGSDALFTIVEVLSFDPNPKLLELIGEEPKAPDRTRGDAADNSGGPPRT